MRDVRVVGALDHNFGWDGAGLVDGSHVTRLRGAATYVDSERVLRDPLGINKLFWVRDGGGVVMASRPHLLVSAGHPLTEVRAIPRGALLDLARDEAASLVPEEWPSPLALDPGEAAKRIREQLDAYLAALHDANPAAQAYVCVSGGLDSSGIAALAAEHFPDAVAVSFDLGDGGEPSEDRLAGQAVAEALGMPLVLADAGAETLLGHLDTVLLEGIDWRDFNVHAGLVNAVLGAAIRDAGGEDALVFTGDLANEFLVDYQPESYRGETYYELPRLPPASLRASLVRGMDTCHREVGVFEAFGLRLVQPYAVAVDAYLSLPEDFLRLPDRKERLCAGIFGDLIPGFVYERKKARAQTGGGEGGGVLGACVDNGVDSPFLKRRFAELHGIDDPAALDGFIRAGRYRSATP